MDYGKVKYILLKILVLNWLVASAKVYIGVFSGSLSILADGLHSFFDGASNIIGLIGIHIARRPEDEGHPYGHKKFESFASLGILFLVTLTVYEIGKSIVAKFFNPVSIRIDLWLFAILGVCLAIDWLVAKYEYRQGRKLNSTILVADSLHTRSHIFTTSSVILGAIAVRLGFAVFDPLIAVFVLSMLLKLAYELFTETSSILCDQAFVDTEKVQNIVRQMPEIRSAHKVRSRGDRGHIFLDMHIILDPSLSLMAAHKISHELKHRIQKEIPEIKDVVIHLEPER